MESRAHSTARRLAVGAELLDGGAHFRVWAPRRARVAVLAGQRRIELEPEVDGWFAGFAEGLRAGQRYRYLLDDAIDVPDPWSRWQPDGPTGASELIDPRRFRWSDDGWRGVRIPGQVIYELHVGTFTEDGTWTAAETELAALAELGVTVLELMPLADFPGAFGWGYDGVMAFAPYHRYGHPDELRRFIDRAHALGLAVMLDIVCNHVGPAGSVIHEFSDTFLSREHVTDWGPGINFDGEDSAAVRAIHRACVRQWIEDYRFDGFRFDATQDVVDSSAEHILAELAREARAAAGARDIILVGENEPQRAELARPAAEGGCGFDALWNDDFHHCAVVALTGRREAYYSDYLGSPQEFVSAAKHGFLYQGQRYAWQRKRRGEYAFDLPATAFVTFVENHDQVANSARGERLIAQSSPAVWRAMLALTLLMPGVPMLFQGQEFGSTRPFLFFADHRSALAEAVQRGRREFLAQFPSMATPAIRAGLSDPAAAETFARCKLRHEDRQARPDLRALHRDLLRLRRRDPVLAVADPRIDGAVLGPQCFVLRWFDPSGDRLLVVSLGADLEPAVAPEPLLAPPRAARWQLAWSSEEAAYGGRGAVRPESDRGRGRVQGPAAVLLRPGAAEER